MSKPPTSLDFEDKVAHDMRDYDYQALNYLRNIATGKLIECEANPKALHSAWRAWREVFRIMSQSMPKNVVDYCIMMFAAMRKNIDVEVTRASVLEAGGRPVRTSSAVMAEFDILVDNVYKVKQMSGWGAHTFKNLKSWENKFAQATGSARRAKPMGD